jgi:hypothetical protein
VEEPVEHEQKDRDRDQPNYRLELLAVARERRDDGLCQHEGDRARHERQARPDQHRPSPAARGADQAGHHRGEDQHRLEALAEDDHRGVRDHLGGSSALAEGPGAVVQRVVERQPPLTQLAGRPFLGDQLREALFAVGREPDEPLHAGQHGRGERAQA